MFNERIDRHVESGLVYCEMHKREVEVDRCLACTRLIEFRAGPNGDEVRCFEPDRRWSVLLAR